MIPVVVPVRSRLRVTYTLHQAENPASERWVVLHHGICHTRDQFLPLIRQVNALGLHAAMIDQQSENAGFFRNCLGVKHYREGMAAAVRRMENEEGLPIGSYAFHSMGALIGEEMQQRHPELARPTVLLAPIPLNGAWPITWRILKNHPLAYLKAVLTLDIHSLLDTPEEVRELFFDDCTPQAIIDATTPQLKHSPFWIYCQLVLRRLVRPRINDNGLAKLLLSSHTDEIFHPAEYDNLAARFPNIEQQQIPGGHDFFIEHAAATARQIAEFHARSPAHPMPGRPHFELRPDKTKPAAKTRIEAPGD